MIHIPRTALRQKLLPHIPQLEAAQAEIDNALPEDRAAVIARHRPLWASLKPLLEELSAEKCWYSECRTAGAPNDVEHFRPKQRVAETSPRHPGYYWLALRWDNFRLSCQRVNRRETDPTTGLVGGKGEHFPLLEGSPRAYVPTDSIDNERPSLFDPLVATDVAMVSFDSAGKITLHPRYQDDPVAQQRLEDSRTFLHLDWHQFVEQRKLLYWEISDLVHSAEQHAPTPGTAPSEEFLDRINRIVALMGKDSEFSRAANVYVRSFRARWWVQDIVLELVAA